MASKKLNRRDFLRMGALTVAGAALAGCGPTPTPQVVTERVVETVVVEKEGERVVETRVVEVEVPGEPVDTGKEVRFLTETWNWEKLNMANATDHYNQELRAAGSGTRIVVDPAPDGWDTKVAQMVKDNELIWNGHLRATTLGDVPRRNRLGILQPWDEYINSSSLPWAANFADDVLPGIKDAFTIDGKLFGLPWDMEVFCRVYNKLIWDRTLGDGVTPAETLDDFEKQLEEIKAADDTITPMRLRHHDGHPDQHMFMQMWTDNPWLSDERGSYLDVKSEAYANYLTMIKRWYDKGIVTDDSWGTSDWNPWNAGTVATAQSGAAWLMSAAQRVWGVGNIVAMNNVVLNPGDQPKTTSFANGAILFKGAEFPQETADWLLWMLDPTVEKVANYSFIRGHLNYYHFPVYQSTYDNILPSSTDWAWMGDILGMLKASATVPADAFVAESVPLINVWEQKFVHGEVTLDEAVTGMYDEFMDAIEKALAG